MKTTNPHLHLYWQFRRNSNASIMQILLSSNAQNYCSDTGRRIENISIYTHVYNITIKRDIK